MKKGGLFLIICLISCLSLADTDMEQMFQPNNPNIIYKDEPRSFGKEALVYIEGISDKPQPKTWKDKLKIKLFGSIDIPNKDLSPELEATPSLFDNGISNTVEIQPTFGHKKEVAFVSHTADWRFMIHPSDTQTIQIQEEISFVLNEDKDSLIKDWPISKEDIQLLWVRLDGVSLPTQPEGDNQNTFLNFQSLKTGTHKISLNYLINPVFQKNQQVLPLIGSKWSLLSDGFSGIIYNNNTYKLDHLKFLIGTNQQEYPENFTITQDGKNNIYFKMNKILPLKTQIQISAETDKILSKNLLNFKSNMFVFLGALFTLVIYLLLSALEIKKMPLEKVLKKFHRQSANLFLQYFYRMGEVIIGTMLLLILTGLFSFVFEINLFIYQWGILVIITLLGLILADIFAFSPTQKQVMQFHLNQQKRSLE